MHNTILQKTITGRFNFLQCILRITVTVTGFPPPHNFEKRPKREIPQKSLFGIFGSVRHFGLFGFFGLLGPMPKVPFFGFVASVGGRAHTLSQDGHEAKDGPLSPLRAPRAPRHSTLFLSDVFSIIYRYRLEIPTF